MPSSYDLPHVDLRKEEEQTKSNYDRTSDKTLSFTSASSLNINPRSTSRDVVDKAHAYEDVLYLIGFGKTQWTILLTAGLLLMAVLNETMGMSIITIASQCDFNTTSVDKALMSAASFIGIFISSYFWGCLSDTIGRRAVLMHTTFAANLVSFVSVFIPNFWLFVFLRLLVGFFIAGASSTTYAYMGEFFSAKHRPVVINYASMFVGISQVYVPAVAWFILAMDWSLSVSDSFAFRPWRLLIVFNLLPGLVAACTLISLPESPRLLLSLGKDDEALAAVEWISRRNTGKLLKEFGVFRLKTEYEKENKSDLLMSSKSPWASVKKMWEETKPLVKPPHASNFIISCCIMCGLFFSSSGMGLWYPDIQNRVGASGTQELLSVCQVIDAFLDQQNSSSTELVCDDTINTKSLIDTITYGGSFIVGFIILGVVLNPIGRKRVVIGFLAVSGLCGLSLLWLLDPIAIVTCFCLFLILPGLCVSVLSGALVDLVPTHLRGKAVCICLMLGRSGSVIGSNLIGVLLNTQCVFTFSFFAGFMFVCAALTFILPI